MVITARSLPMNHCSRYACASLPGLPSASTAGSCGSAPAVSVFILCSSGPRKQLVTTYCHRHAASGCIGEHFQGGTSHEVQHWQPDPMVALAALCSLQAAACPCVFPRTCSAESTCAWVYPSSTAEESVITLVVISVIFRMRAATWLRHARMGTHGHGLQSAVLTARMPAEHTHATACHCNNSLGQLNHACIPVLFRNLEWLFWVPSGIQTLLQPECRPGLYSFKLRDKLPQPPPLHVHQSRPTGCCCRFHAQVLKVRCSCRVDLAGARQPVAAGRSGSAHGQALHPIPKPVRLLHNTNTVRQHRTSVTRVQGECGLIGHAQCAFTSRRFL